MNRLENLECITPFAEKVEHKEWLKTNEKLTTLQVNVGTLCNLACKHCHVEAGPNGKEIMPKEVMDACLELVKKNPSFTTIDITGGAPEMNPNFEWFMEESAKLVDRVIVRSNIVILQEEGYTHLPEKFAENKIEVVASLPYYSEKDCDRQRGKGVFKKIIAGLQRLNELGYGKDKDLVLNLVYNPGGAFFPPFQESLTKQYKSKLFADHGIVFNCVFNIINNPIGRFGAFLERSGNLVPYMCKLEGSFNESAVENMMCRDQISVGWDGKVYDCDFNQAEGLEIEGKKNIFDLCKDGIEVRNIITGKHCYACCAGEGSSCGGCTTE